MAGIFGLAQLSASDYQFNATSGQQIVYEAVMQHLAMVNADMMGALSLFVETETDLFKERYQLPGGGRLQKRGRYANSGAVRASGSWDVAYPLEDFGAQVAQSDVDMGYMTAQEFERHVNTVIEQDINTVRYEMLLKIFKNTDTTFVDPYRGSLTVVPLADGDSVVYPPVIGSESEATDNHYLESGYAASSISDTNNPLVTLRDELEEHFGTRTGGDDIIVLCNNAQRTQLEALTDFVPVIPRGVQAGANVDVPSGFPANVPSSSRIIGIGYGCWVAEWRWIPANYLVAIHRNAPPPLKMRVDPASTNLGRGLQLVARDNTYPIQTAEWRHRFGFGVGNRLSAAVMELGTGGTYTIPTAYQ